MEQDYRVRFTFPAMEEYRERMLPSVALFFRNLEQSDRLMTGALGLELEHHHILQNLGESHFEYSVSLKIRRPMQLYLGQLVDEEALEMWMRTVRGDLIYSLEQRCSASDIADRWDLWAKGQGLHRVLIYTPPDEKVLNKILDGFGKALTDLGGNGSVLFE